MEAREVLVFVSPGSSPGSPANASVAQLVEQHPCKVKV
jgi:hypothetical protein